MINDSKRWLITLIGVLLTILLISLFACLAINKPTISTPIPQTKIEAIKDQIFIVWEEEGKWVIKEKEKPDYINPIFEIGVYNNIWSRPTAFLEINNTDVSEMIQGNRMKLLINGQVYWIRLEK